MTEAAAATNIPIPTPAATPLDIPNIVLEAAGGVIETPAIAASVAFFDNILLVNPQAPLPTAYTVPTVIAPAIAVAATLCPN